jgi:3-methyladenine DNA glycosylase AlkD
MRQLRESADPAVARRSATFFKKDDAFASLGVKAPLLRRIARDIADTVRDTWQVDEAIAFCDQMSRRSHHEAKAVGVLVLGRYRSRLPRRLLMTAGAWLDEGRFATWAAVDLLCPEVVTPLIERHRGLEGTVIRWAEARLLWRRRAAAVSFVPLARHGRYLDAAYEVAQRLRTEPEDLVQKACGWLLREAGRTDPDRLQEFLLGHGAAMARTTMRYAIERFPEGQRRRLLRQTRAW